MGIHVAHCTEKMAYPILLPIFAGTFAVFCLKTAISIFFGKEVHKMVIIGSKESWKNARRLFFFQIRFGDILLGQVQLL